MHVSRLSAPHPTLAPAGHRVRDAQVLAGFTPPVGESPEMRDLFRLAARTAASRAPVMITGETGSGKELVARATHYLGPRRAEPFVAVNCAAVPETLLDGELFGHVKGAFTGAERSRSGFFEEAGAGTLFLDEITEAPASIQAKLLRVLQEDEVRPLGASRSRPVSCRVVASSNRELRSEVARGTFRADLYYRLCVLWVRVPPLRARPADILPLARHFLGEQAAHTGIAAPALSPAAERALLEHAWPGNVRELANAVQRALAFAEPGATIEPDDLALEPEAEGEATAGTAGAACEGPDTLRGALDECEVQLIRRALARHAGHRSATARALGITREGLYKKMKRLGIA